MYVGIGPNHGQTVADDKAMEYAANNCGISIDYKTPIPEAAEFRRMFLEWYFSGEWINEKE